MKELQKLDEFEFLSDIDLASVPVDPVYATMDARTLKDGYCKSKDYHYLSEQLQRDKETRWRNKRVSKVLLSG